MRRFTESTAMRPFLAGLDEAEAAPFISPCEADLATAWPTEEDDSVLFAVCRLFIALARHWPDTGPTPVQSGAPS